MTASAIDLVNMDAQKQATDEILSRMDKYLTGSQLYELNKVLNDEFNKVIFTKKKENLHYDVESENRYILNEFYQGWQVNRYLYHGLPVPHIEEIHNVNDAYDFFELKNNMSLINNDTIVDDEKSTNTGIVNSEYKPIGTGQTTLF